MAVQLIADSGSTKCEWCLLSNGKKKIINTQGISPYFVKREDIVAILENELIPELKNVEVEELYFYGTGLTNPANEKVVRLALKQVFSGVEIFFPGLRSLRMKTIFRVKKYFREMKRFGEIEST